MSMAVNRLNQVLVEPAQPRPSGTQYQRNQYTRHQTHITKPGAPP